MVTEKIIAFELWRRYERAHATGQPLPPLKQLTTAVQDAYPSARADLINRGIDCFLEGLFATSVQKIRSHHQLGAAVAAGLIADRQTAPSSCLRAPSPEAL